MLTVFLREKIEKKKVQKRMDYPKSTTAHRADDRLSMSLNDTDPLQSDPHKCTLISAHSQACHAKFEIHQFLFFFNSFYYILFK